MYNFSISLSKWFNFHTRLAGNFSNQCSGHSGSVRVCGQFWDGTGTNPMVHSGWVIRSRSTSCSHRCGGMLQLDRQLSCRTAFPKTIGENLQMNSSVSHLSRIQELNALWSCLLFRSCVKRTSLSYSSSSLSSSSCLPTSAFPRPKAERLRTSPMGFPMPPTTRPQRVPSQCQYPHHQRSFRWLKWLVRRKAEQN